MSNPLFPHGPEHLKAALDKRETEDSLRKLHAYPGLVDFCSNDYLGFARSPELQANIREALSRLEKEHVNLNGSSGSRLISGNSRMAEQTEARIASFHKAPAALLFNSGYDANVGLFSSVARRNDVVLFDESIHASVRDGLRLSFARSYSFRHNDCAHLEELLQRNTDKVVFIAIESVYSMDGDLAPLREYAALSETYHAHLIVDEAHATGIFGESGEGRVAGLGLEEKVFARVHTFGKALGCHGAVVVGSKILREHLVNFARSFIYTTALPLHSLVAAGCAYDLLDKSKDKREKLNRLTDDLIRETEKLPGRTGTSHRSPIQTLMVPGNSRARRASALLREKGFDVRAILSPTVPRDSERLRICLHSYNSREEVTALAAILQEISQSAPDRE